MKEVLFDLGRARISLFVPETADVYRMGKPSPLQDPQEKIRLALRRPIQAPPLAEVVRRKLRSNPGARAVVVISDATRPVPYSGDSGILYPLLEEMLGAGLPPDRILLLVATGTHRAMDEGELKAVLDPRVLALGIRLINHDSRNLEEMVSLDLPGSDGPLLVNRFFMESDIKILTGLVESHFMAGVSGGRKSICPGLVSETSTHALHSGPILQSPRARDLILEGNPVHEASLRVARAAGCDFIVNVTLDADYRLTGVFAGDLEKAHLEAYRKLMSYAAIPVAGEYDMVISHAGYVGVNHYQAAKGALVCVPLLKHGGLCILAAHHPDKDPVGGNHYQDMLKLLVKEGASGFISTILDPSWSFVPEQWEVQMWTRLFEKTEPENLLYCSLDIPPDSFAGLPATDARSLVKAPQDLQDLVNKTIRWALGNLKRKPGGAPSVAVLPDGPYGIPVKAAPSRATLEP